MVTLLLYSPLALIDTVAQWDEAVFQTVNEFARSQQGNEIDFFLRTASEWGSGYAVAFVAVAVALACRTSASLHARMRRILLSQFLVAIVVRLLKHAVDRDRPARAMADRFADGSLDRVFDLHASLSSMPSGHTATIWCLVTVLLSFSSDLRTRWRVLFGSGALATAVSASFARIYAGVHYPSDVLVGAALGVSIALVALWLLRRLEDTRPSTGTHREPVA